MRQGTSVPTTTEEGPPYPVEGLGLFLKAIPKENLAEYGFENEAQLKAPQLEKPFQLHIVSPQDLRAGSNQELASMMSATDTWYFPISAEGQVRSLLLTRREGNIYRAVGIGHLQLARELGRARAQWPVARGYSLKLVKVLRSASYAEFVLRESDKEPAGLAPLLSGRRVLGENLKQADTNAPLHTIDPRSVLTRLRAIPESKHAMQAKLVRPLDDVQAASKAEPAKAPSSISGSVSVNVPELPARQQLMSNWCWATMVQAMLARHDIPLEQCYLVQWALDEAGANNYDVCAKPGDSNFSETGVGSHEMMLNWGVPGSICPRALTWAEIKNQINSGNPIVRFITWSDGAHYTIVKGYSAYTSAGTRWHFVNIMDPGCGDCVILLYDSAVDDGTVTWQSSRVTESINQSYSQGVIGFRNGSARALYAFVRGDDKNVHVNYWDGSGWYWADQGTPPGTLAIWDPAVVTYRDGDTQRIYSFVTGENRHLYVNYWDGAQWFWADQGAPAGTLVSGGPGVIVLKKDCDDYNLGNAPRLYAFVRGQDGHLYVNYWDGSSWVWADQGTPPGTSVQSMPAAITFRQHKVTQIHVFMMGENGRLYSNYWDGSAWHWSDQGKPAGAKVASHAHVITYKEGDQTRIYAFVKGDNDRLYVNYYDGVWHWSDHGKPSGTKVSQLNPGVITYRQEDRQRIYSFVTGDNGHLYVNYWDGSAWHWADQGTPPGTKVAETLSQHPGTLTYRKGDTRKIFAFVMGTNNHLYMNYWDGHGWKWSDQKSLAASAKAAG